MNGKILDRYSGRASELASAPSAAGEPDSVEDHLGAFGWLRGTRDRAVMLELRKKTGDTLAVGYGWIDRIEFDPSTGIILHCGGKEIHIKGRNLNGEARPQIRLFQGLTRHRVPWIQESGHGAAIATDKQAPMIESIEW